jgi:hypothetical protein
MNKITIVSLAVLAISCQAQGMYTKKGLEIIAGQKAQRAALAANMSVQKAKIVLVPVSKPAPACSKEEYYNVRVPLINASKAVKNRLQGLTVSTVVSKPQEGVQQRTLVGRTVATLAPFAALGGLIAYDQGLLQNVFLADAIKSIDVANATQFLKSYVINPMIRGGQIAAATFSTRVSHDGKN